MEQGTGSREATPRPWTHGPLFWEGWAVSDDLGVTTRVFEVPHTYPEGSHQAGVFVDPQIGRTREADAALIVEAVNAFDRLRAIEAAARAVVPAIESAAGPHPTHDASCTFCALREALAAR